MGEVYSIGIDLSQLQKALQMSLQIKNNLASLGGNSSKGQSGGNSQVQKSSSSFNNSIQQQNKGLKEQNKLLGGSLQKLNLIRLVSSKIKWGALGAIGLAGTGITAGIAAMNGSLSTNTRAKNIGLGFGESNALNFAGKMTGLGEDTLMSSIEGLTTSLQDYSKWGNFASLGLNASDLQNKNPTEALFEVLESMKNSDLKKTLVENGIGGLEFVCSVPGRIGGLLRTNAGCFGKSISDVFVKAHIMNEWGRIYETTAEDFNFSYRSSMFPEDWIILDVTLKGVKAEPQEIKNTMDEQQRYRMEHQPINKKTAGSTFKNPEGLQAWKLIKEAGCAGLKVGGAEVSDKHCNFLINRGTATAEDIEELGELIIEKVKEKTAITLEWEVRRMGVKK